MGTANIAFGFAGAVARGNRSDYFSQSGDAENLTTTNLSATTSNVSAPAGSVDEYARERLVRIVLSEEGYVRIGATAAVGTGLRCLADTEYIFSCNQGQTVSIIDTA